MSPFPNWFPDENDLMRVSTRRNSEQDKLAEMQASGDVLNRYDSELWGKHFSYKVENLRAAKLDTLSGAFVLDFGCGPGTFGVILGQKNNVIGIDIARQAVEQTRDRAKKFHSSMDVVCGDGEELCLRGGSFDVCFSGWAIHHLPHVENVARSFYELLKPGGTCVIIEPNENAFGMRAARFFEDRIRGLILKSGLDTPNRTTHTKQEYIDALKAAGFKIEAVFTHYNGEKSEIPKDIGHLKGMALRTMIYVRHLLLWFSARVMRDGADIFFIARKAI